MSFIVAILQSFDFEHGSMGVTSLISVIQVGFFLDLYAGLVFQQKETSKLWEQKHGSKQLTPQRAGTN